jgi:flagellar biogenesis protein FliO
MEATRQIPAVFLVLVLLGGALWALRRGAGPLRGALRRATRDQSHSLQVMGRITLTPHHSLHIVRAGAREWVVATHPQGCTVISSGDTTGAAA